VAAIKVSKYLGLGPGDLVLTVATDGAEMYLSEVERVTRRDFPDGFDTVHAGETFARHLAGAATDHVLELGERDRARIFNLGYYTWVEQQGVSIGEFVARRDQAFWRGLRDLLPAWDALIAEFNARTAAAASA